MSTPDDHVHDADDYSGIFDHLEPDDFDRATSAVFELPSRNLGRDAFDAFVDEQIRMLTLAYTASEGRLDPVAVLASPSVRRTFLPDADESMGQYVARLRREAHLIRAHWVFISKVTEVGVHPVDRDRPHAADDATVAEAAHQQGTLRKGVVWYAELREGLRRTTRVGVMFDEDRRLGSPFETGSQGLSLFGEILDGTP